MTTDTAPSARVAIFDWLQRKYVQRQDDRQKALGLVYMEAETHDLAEEIERQVAPLDAEIARLQAQVAELQARCIDAESDARRYQHLRNQEAGDFPPKHGSVWVVMYEHPVGTIPSMVSAGHGERLDANVDAALAAAGR